MSARKDLRAMHGLSVVMIWMSAHDCHADEELCAATAKAVFSAVSIISSFAHKHLQI